MTSRAISLLGFDLTSTKEKDVVISIEMVRVLAKLRVSGSKVIIYIYWKIPRLRIAKRMVIPQVSYSTLQ